MEKTDRELLIKEISARLPYRIKAVVRGWNDKGLEAHLEIYSINADGYVYFVTNEYGIHYLSVEKCRLYLRPMSSMAKAENTEMHLVIYSARVTGEYFRITDFYNKHHFDYHGLIEKGLALEAPEGMYNK